MGIATRLQRLTLSVIRESAFPFLPGSARARRVFPFSHLKISRFDKKNSRFDKRIPGSILTGNFAENLL
jgi:hypothetical protein